MGGRLPGPQASGMECTTTRADLRALQQQVASAAQGWTLAVCSDNVQVAVIASLVLQRPLISRSIAELLSLIPSDAERLLVIADDQLCDGGADQLLAELRSHRQLRCYRCLVYVPRSISDGRLQQLWQCGPDGLLSFEGGGNGSGLRALLALLAGEECLDPYFSRRLRQLNEPGLALPGAAWPLQLSPQELELIRALACGMSAREIAARRRVRDDSLRRQLSTLYRRIGVRDQRTLVNWALAQGLIRLPDLNAMGAGSAAPAYTSGALAKGSRAAQR